jgi:hypothetical protein
VREREKGLLEHILETAGRREGAYAKHDQGLRQGRHRRVALDLRGHDLQQRHDRRQEFGARLLLGLLVGRYHRVGLDVDTIAVGDIAFDDSQAARNSPLRRRFSASQADFCSAIANRRG